MTKLTESCQRILDISSYVVVIQCMEVYDTRTSNHINEGALGITTGRIDFPPPRTKGPRAVGRRLGEKYPSSTNKADTFPSSKRDWVGCLQMQLDVQGLVETTRLFR